MFELERRRREVEGCTFSPQLSPGTKKLARAHYERKQKAEAAALPPPPPPPYNEGEGDQTRSHFTGVHRHRGPAAFGSHDGTGRAGRAVSTWAGPAAPQEAHPGASGVTHAHDPARAASASAYGKQAAAGVTNAKAKAVTSRLYDGHYHRDRSRRLAAARAKAAEEELRACSFTPTTHAAPKQSKRLSRVLDGSPRAKALELKKKTVLLSATPTKPVGFGSGVSRQLHARGWQPDATRAAQKKRGGAGAFESKSKGDHRSARLYQQGRASRKKLEAPTVGFGSGVSRQLHARGWQPNATRAAQKKRGGAGGGGGGRGGGGGGRPTASAKRGSFYGTYPGGKKPAGARAKGVSGDDRHGGAFGSSKTTGRAARPAAQSVWTAERSGGGKDGGRRPASYRDAPEAAAPR